MTDDELRTAVRPWQDLELKMDLWPRMLRRLEDAPASFGWFEAVLAASITLVFVIFPDLIPVMFYHL